MRAVDARPVAGYGSSRYLVDAFGNVFSRGRLFDRMLVPQVVINTGYEQVKLYEDGTHRFRRVHHLVLEAFVGPRPAGMETRHLNGVRADNRLENLAWGTPTENAADKIRHGTATRRRRT